MLLPNVTVLLFVYRSYYLRIEYLYIERQFQFFEDYSFIAEEQSVASQQEAAGICNLLAIPLHCHMCCRQ